MMTQKKVVIVEDNKNDIALMERVLKKDLTHIDYIFFDDSSEALAWLSSLKDPQLLLSVLLFDIKMPKLNGLELLKEMRSLDGFRSIPIVILSSSDQLSDRDTAYSYGANSFLEKPKSYIELKENLPIILKYWLELNKFL